MEKQDYSLMAKFRLGEIYYYLGDLDSSKAVFQHLDVAPLNLKIASMFYLGMIHSQRGEREEALRIIDEINLISPQELVFNDDFWLASVYLSIGNKESGYELLKHFFNKTRNINMRFVWLKYIDIDRNFDRVREEEEFIRIAKK